jgi:pyruvate/2-oxoglutarate dehydrogenase complex dihydrolipoamide dehydrogenase (E3) component
MFDLIVIGGGPAGVTAALRARELGASTLLIERGPLGGTCTNDGCVPTRVLARAARLMRDSRQFAEYGLEAPPPTVDFRQLLARTQQLVYAVHEKKQLISHLQSVGVKVVHDAGPAQFIDAHTVQLEDGRTFSAHKFVLCAGGHARRLDIPGGEWLLTHSDVWTLEALPDSVAIIGGGATGCQLATIFHTLGAQVRLLDIAPRLLLSEDALVAERVETEFSRQGITVQTGIGGIQAVERRADGRFDLVYTDDGEQQRTPATAIIQSVGWPSNAGALRLAEAGVELRGPYVLVNDRLQTTAAHIYAAGDMTGRMMLVQSASHQARVAVENALLDAGRIDENRLVPHGGFTDPEYGGVGPTEAQARAQGDVAVAIVPYSDMDRAVIDGRPVGFCKLIVDRTNRRIVGAHVVGEQAVEIVNMVAAAMMGEARVEQLAELEFAYPTFAAILGLAARQLARELSAVPLGPEWRALSQLRIAEWERRAVDSATGAAPPAG